MENYQLLFSRKKNQYSTFLRFVYSKCFVQLNRFHLQTKLYKSPTSILRTKKIRILFLKNKEAKKSNSKLKTKRVVIVEYTLSSDIRTN